MKITVTQDKEFTPEELAKSMAETTQEEFAAFWFAFSEACEGDKLDEFAKAMAVRSGAKRKKPLIELCGLMKYYEVKEKKRNSI